MNYPEKTFHRPQGSDGLTVALVDARYLRWLARSHEADGEPAGLPSREGVNEMLRHALNRSGVRASVLRTYWYADQDDQAVHDEQTLRLLPAGDSDGRGAAAVAHEISGSDYEDDFQEYDSE
jgi:hypothetical protein